jgi:hypothetical protein
VLGGGGVVGDVKKLIKDYFILVVLDFLVNTYLLLPQVTTTIRGINI